MSAAHVCILAASLLVVEQGMERSIEVRHLDHKNKLVSNARPEPRACFLWGLRTEELRQGSVVMTFCYLSSLTRMPCPSCLTSLHAARSLADLHAGTCT